MAVGALSPDGLVRETALIKFEVSPDGFVAVGALSPDGLVGETHVAVGTLSPDGLVGETPLIN